MPPNYQFSVKVRSTPHSGRGVFATSSIPENTNVQVCPTPYAYVIYRKFRKEVCGWCFKYAFETGKNSWKVRSDEIKGLWFCSSDCLQTWKDDYFVSPITNTVGSMLDSFEKLAGLCGKAPSILNPESIMSFSNTNVSEVDDAWIHVESLVASPAFSKSLKEVDICCLTPREINMARFAMECIIRRFIEDKKFNSSASDEEETKWSDLLDLQDSEETTLRSYPEHMQSQLRVYLFLAFMCRKFVKGTQLNDYFLSTSQIDETIKQPQQKQTTDRSEKNAIRALFARESTNVFGIYEDNDNVVSGAECEMLGYALYVSASYFNHNCSPNVKKKREGRAMLFKTVTSVKEGEELCTNYVTVDGEEGAWIRRHKELKEVWGFDCCCERCTREVE